MNYPFSSPLYVMAKPASAACNLACRYCYYLDKANMYEDTGKRVMTEQLLELFTRQYLEAQTQPEVLFTWHGGEPLLRPLAFYQKALQLQRQYGRGRTIDNCLQTNGTLLNDEWCRFFKDNGFLIGISIDGPEALHDAYRKTRGGNPTWRSVMHGVELLQRYGVEWNAMATVNHINADHPTEFYRFFRDIGCQYLQFTPVVEREGNRIADYSVTPQQWGRFTCDVYDEWVQRDVGSIFVQLFDTTLANWMGVAPGLCSLSTMCGHSLAMEYNGDVYSCDHYVFPEYHLGNIRQQSLTEMAYGAKQQLFRQMKTARLPRQCHECRWLFACHGECPKNRLDRGVNYLCEGYRQFFAHVASDMDFMREELKAQRSPANIMNHKKPR